MRKFSSYGPVNNKLHFFAPREYLIRQIRDQLIGDEDGESGHCITVWAPRQTGKSWIMREALAELRQSDNFEVCMISFQSAKTKKTDEDVLRFFVKRLRSYFSKELPDIASWEDIADLFTKTYFQKPVILILDEFDALREDFINKFANEFRDMYMRAQIENGGIGEKDCLLHGLALIGVRSVLGIENVKGSPFNVQRSVHIPNLTFEEVESMFQWWEKESVRKVPTDCFTTWAVLSSRSKTFPTPCPRKA